MAYLCEGEQCCLYVMSFEYFKPMGEASQARFTMPGRGKEYSEVCLKMGGTPHLLPRSHVRRREAIALQPRSQMLHCVPEGDFKAAIHGYLAA